MRLTMGLIALRRATATAERWRNIVLGNWWRAERLQSEVCFELTESNDPSRGNYRNLGIFKFNHSTPLITRTQQ